MNSIGLFLGTERGYNVLKALLEQKKEVAFVLILEQQKHEHLNFTNKIIALCQKHNIKFKTSAEVSSKEYVHFLQSNPCSVLFVISWRFLIPETCFRIPKKGIFVLHDSLLPKYRGFSPTNWVILQGEKETGLTLQYIHTDMDAGDIVDQIRVKIDENETARTLNDKLLPLYPKIILDNVDAILAGKNKVIAQDNSKATYGCKRTPEDGHINFSMTTKQIVQLIRGLTYPYPGAFCFYNDKRITIWTAEEVQNPLQYVGRIPGRIVGMQSTHIDVLTGDGILRITAIGTDTQLEIQLKDVFTHISKTLH